MLRSFVLSATLGLLLLAGCQECPEAPPGADFGTTTGNTQSTPDASALVPFSEQIIYDVLIRTSPEDDETDWRLTNVDATNRDAWLEAIFNAIREGKLTAYAHPLGIPTREAEWAIQPEAFDALLTDTTIVWVENIDTEEMEESMQVTTTGSDEVFRLDFVEDWKYDLNTLQLVKTVTGMSCMTPVFSLETGEFRGNKKLFWVWFTDEPMLDYPA